MRKIRTFISMMLVSAVVFTGAFAGVDLTREAYAGTAEPEENGYEYEEGRVIVCVQECEEPENGSKDESKKTALFSMLPFGEQETAESLLANADELMDVSDAAQEMLSEENSLLSGEEISSARMYAGEGNVKTSLKVVDSEKYSTEELIDKLSSLPQVVFAEPDYIVHTDTSVTDGAEYALQDAMDHTGNEAYNGTEESDSIPDLTSCQYAFGNGPGGIDVPDWNDPSKKNAEGAVVAVLDTGIDYEHPDLDDVMWDEGLKYQSLKQYGGGKYGYCAIKSNSKGISYRSDDPRDDNDHGTYCSGIIAAEWDGKGISGAVNGARLMAVKAVDEIGGGNITAVVDGINYILEAKKTGVNVAAANASLSYPVLCKTMEAATRELGINGVVYVSASGNDAFDTDYVVSDNLPIATAPGKIVVNSNDGENLVSDFSNFGIRTTDVFAPGSNILSGCIESKTFPTLMKPAKDRDGALMVNDFEGEGYFDIADVSDKFDISFSTAKDPQSKDNHALKTTFTLRKGDIEQQCRLISLKPKNPNARIKEDGDQLSFIMRARSDTEDMYILAFARTRSGSYRLLDRLTGSRTMQSLEFNLTDDIDNEALEIIIGLYAESGVETGKEMTLWLDDCRLSADQDKKIPYEIGSGTSASAPAVSGEAAILACTFPEDSAKKIAARILGSAVPYEQYNGLCVSGGLANVRNAINEDYMPVVNEIQYQNDGSLAISGYFFGNLSHTGVKLSQYGTDYECEITGLQEDSSEPGASTVSVRVPDGLKSGEVIVYVSDSSKASGRQTGSRHLSIVLPDGSDPFYNRLPGWDDIEYNETHTPNAAWLDDGLFLTGIDPFKDDTEYKEWYRSYKLKDGEYSRLEKPFNISYEGNICAFDKKIWYFDEIDGKLKIYDPESNKTDSYYIQGSSGYTPGDNRDLVNIGDKLLIINAYEDKPAEVWTLDPFTLIMEKAVDLKAIYGGINIYGLNETKQGREIYIGLGSMTEGGKKSVMEKILINSATGVITREFVSEDVLPEGFVFPKELVLSDVRAAGSGTKRGIYLAGGYKLKEGTDQIEADNWYFDYAHPEKGFVPCDKLISSGRLLNAAVTCYKNKVYFIGNTLEKDGSRIIAYKEEETWDLGDEAAVPDPQPEKEIAALEINGEKSLKLSKGDSVVLSCKVSYPEGMAEADRPPLIYKSENRKLVRINPLTGELLAVMPGSTKVSASCGNKTVSFDITVSSDTSPTVLEKSLTMKAGEQYSLNFDPGYATGNEKVVWSSLDNKTATVKNGLITAKKAGTTLIRVTVKEGSTVKSTQECYLTVTDTPQVRKQTQDKKAKLSLNKSSIKANVGDTIGLKAFLSGSGKDTASVTAGVTNENIIEQDAGNEGKSGQASGGKLIYDYSFKAVSPGTAYIAVTSTSPDGAQNVRLCKVTIMAPAKSLDLSTDDVGDFDSDGILYIKNGSRGRLYCSVNPETCTDTAITWKAKGGAVTVKNGVFTAKKVSKKDKTGKYIPDTITVKCGKVTKNVEIVVTE